jgi:hypothetical protein
LNEINVQIPEEIIRNIQWCLNQKGRTERVNTEKIDRHNIFIPGNLGHYQKGTRGNKILIKAGETKYRR